MKLIKVVMEKNEIKRPSARATEEEWDEFLSNNIIWAIDIFQYGINANTSIITDKSNKSLEVVVELDNCKGQNIGLQAIVYNANKRIIGHGSICWGHKTGFMVDYASISLNCSVTKIDKIVIGGKVE